MIPDAHPHLVGVLIAHLLKITAPPKKTGKPPRLGKKITMAKTSKVSPKVRAIASADFQFIIEYDSSVWDALTQEGKDALVDHELCHCGNDADGCYLKAHGLEEFPEIVDRHGLWKNDVQQFADQTEKVYHAEKVCSAEGAYSE